MSKTAITCLIKSLTLTFMVSVTLLPQESTSANIYSWKDEDGKLHFSAKAAEAPNSILFNKTTIQQIPLSSVNRTLKILNKSNSSYKRHKNSKSSISTGNHVSKCDKIRSHISAIEVKLTKKLKASVFDKLNEQLNNLQWLKIKRC